MSTALTHIETEKQLVPALRFKEFDEEWNEILLDDFAQRGSGHTPSKSYPEYYNGDINWISLTDSKRLDNGFIEKTNSTITQKGIDNSSAVLHPAGTVLLSRDAGVGKSAVMKHSMAVSQHFIVWRTQEDKSSNWFLYNWLQIMKPHFERMAVGNTIKTIGLPYFKKLKIVTPQYAEQQKIASFLSSVDEKIQQLTNKKELLEQYKKGVMQQLFSGQLRFKDENGNPYPDWEEKKISEVCLRSTGRSKSNDIIEAGINTIVDMGAVSKEGKLLGSKRTDCEEDYLETGDLVMAKDDIGGGQIIGKVVLIPVNDKYILGDHVYKLKVMKGDVKFLHYSINSYGVNKAFRRKANGTAQIGINNKTVDDQLIPFPCLEEQQKIATYLSRIDTKIESVNNQITQSQTFKKGLLQQMFV